MRDVMWKLGLLVICCLLASTGHVESAAPSRAWPRDSALPRAAGKRTLLVFVHANDPGGERTLIELHAIVASSLRKPFVAVVHVADERPAGLWETAGRIPRAARLLDRGAVEARRFGATATGHALLFRSDGTLVYSGALAGVRAAL